MDEFGLILFWMVYTMNISKDLQLEYFVIKIWCVITNMCFLISSLLRETVAFTDPESEYATSRVNNNNNNNYSMTNLLTELKLIRCNGHMKSEAWILLKCC